MREKPAPPVPVPGVKLVRCNASRLQSPVPDVSPQSRLATPRPPRPLGPITLYVKSDASANPNPSHHEIQDKFEDAHQQPPTVEGKATKIYPNHDLGARTGVFGKIQDCGKHLPGVVDGVDPDDWSRQDVERATLNLQRAWGISRFTR
jgi:hypothetical protein